MNGKQNSTRGMATNNILYFVMFFDLCKAPAAVFQYFWNEIFLDLFDCVIVYLDDIFVLSSDLSTHRQHNRTLETMGSTQKCKRVSEKKRLVLSPAGFCQVASRLLST